MTLTAVFVRIDDRDWTGLSLGQRIKQLELEGYLVLPDVLSRPQIEHFRELTSTLETKAVDYSDKQRGRKSIHFDHPDLAEMIECPPVTAFLRELLSQLPW